MSVDATLLLLLAVCCWVLLALQASLWPRWLQLAAPLALVALLLATGDLASHTSMASILQWAANPQRRQDLAALMLAETLLYGCQAICGAQGQSNWWWRLLSWLPLPSAMLMLFFAQVGVMLLVDGWDYQQLGWLCALSFVLVLAAISALLHWALPEMSVRHVLRVGLHGVQALAALWLARPALPPSVDPVPLWGERLAATACVVLALAAVGWWWQRRR